MPSNALIHEKSPYLLQHAHNPVHWQPWGEAAFEQARREDKPIFLSVGYSTCHWCHVMEHESFENEQIAEILNRNFVSIKVDREERPDVDRIYMLFVQASSGSGGWPMSVWLTPELKPFFGGTYFPPDSRYGRPGFVDVLKQIHQAWLNNREKLTTSSDNIVEQLRTYLRPRKETALPTEELFASGYEQFRRSFDSHFGGFGSSPKFPRPVTLNYLLRYHALSQSAEALDMVTATLRAMAAGGMNDQLGGGFHRYSVDRRWFVPHFEKMLYDQAQLATSFLEAFQITKGSDFEAVAHEIFKYLLRDMRAPEGAFFSAEDADSPDPENPGHKREGAFYVWRQSQIEAVLGKDEAAWFCHYYGVQPNGNVQEDPHGEFSGWNILYQASTVEDTAQHYGVPVSTVKEALERSGQTLFELRTSRPRPHLDDKILTAWNALLISAFAKAAQLAPHSEYLQAAAQATEFLMNRMYSLDSGVLLRRFREADAAVPGFLDDYAFFAQALLDLFETTFNPEYLVVACKLATEGFVQFEDEENGGFFSTAGADANLLLRIKDDYDGAEPSGNSVATDVLLRLAHLTGNESFRARAEKSLQAFVPKLREQPTQAPQMMVAAGRWLAEPDQLVVRCESITVGVLEFIAQKRAGFLPFRSVAVIPDAAVEALRSVAPFLASLSRNSAATVYECRNFACQLPYELP
jgi:hypothetical protein